MDDDRNGDRVDKGTAAAIAIENVHVAAHERHTDCARSRTRKSSARSVAIRCRAVEIKKRLLSNRPALLHNLRQHEKNTQRRRRATVQYL